MYYVMRASAPSLHRESTDSLISLGNKIFRIISFIINVNKHAVDIRTGPSFVTANVTFYQKCPLNDTV